ncbi:MAG: SH3 domain-containing protein [Mogibacterium sp.]|nr:SH3 domain-containing protein [Mogibacterium sp.]
MICRYCGKKVPDDAIYCPFCGKRVEAHLRRENTESHLRKEDPEAHLRQEDRDLEKENAKKKKKREKYIEEPAGKRRVKSLISIIAAIAFVVAAFIVVMVFIKPYIGEEPWPDKDRQTAETEESFESPKTMYISTEEGVILQKEPGTKGKAIHLLNYGREIEVEKIQDSWAYTTVDGLSGWCSAEYLTENKDDIRLKEIKPKSEADKGQLVEPSIRILTGYHGTVNSEDGLNLRCGPGEEYDILLVVPYKTEVIEEGWNDGWIYIRYEGQYGWVKSEYVTPTGEVENVSQ